MVIKWKHFPRYWHFVRGIHRSTVNSPHKGQWRGALMFSLICTRKYGWVNNREAGDLRRHGAHYDVTVMIIVTSCHHCCRHPGRQQHMKLHARKFCNIIKNNAWIISSYNTVSIRLYITSMIRLCYTQVNSMVSYQKCPTRHAYAWQIGPFWLDALEYVHSVSANCPSVNWKLGSQTCSSTTCAQNICHRDLM